MHLLFQLSWFFYLFQTSFSVEEEVREKNLEPRHFNPHPYQNGVRKRNRIGPVVFPYNEEDNREPYSNFVRLSRIDPAEEVPYQKIAKKHRKKKIGRYEVQDEKINPQLEQALAKHGAKVLKLPPEKLAKDHVPFARDIHKRHNYAFSYKVLDHSSGDDFSHSQVQDSTATNGEYRVKLPDGRLQIVSYTADQNGYKADVKYTNSEDDHYETKKHYQDPVYQIEQIPVRQLRPVKTNTKQQQIDYYDDVHPANQPIVKLKTVVPTAIPHNYDSYGNFDSDYGSFVVTPSPGYSNSAVSANANYQLPLPLNVQIYTTNSRDYTVGSYVPFLGSTPRTYHTKDINNYRQNIISPQIVNNGDHGLVLPVSTPSSFVLTDQHGQVIDNIKLVSSTAVPFLVSTTPVPVSYGPVHSTTAPYTRYK